MNDGSVDESRPSFVDERVAALLWWRHSLDGSPSRWARGWHSTDTLHLPLHGVADPEHLQKIIYIDKAAAIEIHDFKEHITFAIELSLISSRSSACLICPGTYSGLPILVHLTDNAHTISEFLFAYHIVFLHVKEAENC